MAQSSSEYITDAEFGKVSVRRSHLAKYIRLKMRPDRSISISMPPRASLRAAEKLLDEARPMLRRELQKSPRKIWQDGDVIGQSHTLVIKQDHLVPTITTSVNANKAVVLHHPSASEADIQARITEFALKLLRKQAKAYLPRRLANFAEKYGFYYQTLRFSTAETRWGSCSSNGTISLNIWLMSLPPELIDYVLVHELAHTKQMNHSPEFWRIVGDCLPAYKTLRAKLKKYSPAP